MKDKKELKNNLFLRTHIYFLFVTKDILPGRSSDFRSLCFTPSEQAGDEPWTFFSAFSTSYDPGAII